MKGKNTLPDQTHHCDADGPMGEARERRAGLGWNSEPTAADSFVEAVPNPFVEKLQARINLVTASPWVSSRAPDSPLNARSQLTQHAAWPQQG